MAKKKVQEELKAEVIEKEAKKNITGSKAPAAREESTNEAKNLESSDKKLETTPAKAGKRSPKALKEAEEKQAKEERKQETSESKAESPKPKVAHKPARSKLERSGKKFREAAKLVDNDKVYELKEALELATKTSPVKFDATVELHVRLGVDPRQADQNIRDNLVLPSGTGKAQRVTVLAEADDAATAVKAGADFAGNEEVIEQLEKGVFDFDVLIATPKLMARLGKYARVLGPKGLMPNPKSGTVTSDVAKAVKDAKAGKVEYRVDSTGIVHLGIGKVSFGTDKLLQNAQAVLASLRAAKPASVKSAYARAIHITTSMGPSMTVNTNAL